MPGMRRTSLVLFVVVFATPTAFAQTQAPSIEEMAKRIGFSEQARERGRNGEVIAERLEATSDKDLTLAVGAKIEAPPQKVYDFVPPANRAAPACTRVIIFSRVANA